jgi:dTDP-4-dehydrorhamnose 3,5-epimerase-like enzyme
METKIIKIKKIISDCGILSIFESNRDIPFEIKRIYYTYNAPLGTKRGMHAHKKLKQILFCPYGKIKVILDNGTEKKNVILDDPSKGLIIRGGIWRDLIWLKENSVLVVAASDYYDANDYIRDYNEFLNYKGK